MGGDGMTQRTRHANAADDLAYLLRNASPDVAADNAAALAELRNAGALGGAAPAYRLTEAKPRHDAPQPAAQSCILPLPPSTNDNYEHARGRIVLSDEVRNYRKAVAIIAAHAGCVPYTGPVAIYTHVYRARKAGDLDNYDGKVLWDALNGIMWQDDAQVVERHGWRHDDAAQPRVEVEVRKVAEGEA